MLIEVCFRPECINLQVLYGIPEVKKKAFIHLNVKLLCYFQKNI